MRAGRCRQQEHGRERDRRGAHVAYASMGHETFSPVSAAPSRDAAATSLTRIWKPETVSFRRPAGCTGVRPPPEGPPCAPLHPPPMGHRPRHRRPAHRHVGRRGRRPAPLLPDALRLRADLGGLDLRRPLARPGQHRPRRVDRRRRQHEPGRARPRLGRRHRPEDLHQPRRRPPRLPRPRRRLGHPLHPPRVDPAAHRGPEGRPGRADRPRRQQRHRGRITCTTRSCATAWPCGSRSTAR